MVSQNLSLMSKVGEVGYMGVAHTKHDLDTLAGGIAEVSMAPHVIFMCFHWLSRH